jgi:transposase-like protein
MKRKQYSEEQIITILKEAESGATVADVIRKHGPLPKAPTTAGKPNTVAWT